MATVVADMTGPMKIHWHWTPLSLRQVHMIRMWAAAINNISSAKVRRGTVAADIINVIEGNCIRGMINVKGGLNLI